MLLRHAVLAAAEPGEEAVTHSQPPSIPSLPAHLTLRVTVLKQTGFGIIMIALSAALSVISTLAHQTPAEQSWRLWLSPALHERTFELHGRKPTPVLCSLITPFPVPELCRKKG